MSPNITNDLAQGKVAKFTGGFFIAYILTSVLASMHLAFEQPSS